ncbi:MAG: zinc-binding dehydrogenase, partial [Actinobacteria bacterium]|nr:zinc-binding dehydrogenase [Actinomycetota bacterium]
GAADAVVYGGEDFGDRLDATLEGRGLDVVLEVVGSDVYRALLARLAPFGRIVVAGYAGLDYRRWNPLSWWRAWRGVPRLDVVKASSSSIGVSATHLGYLLADEARLRAVWAELSEFTRAHRLRPVVGRTYGFEELPEAHRFMESRRSVGKLVVLVQ